MYKNYIFDLYGTLVDINTDEESFEFWYKLSLFYSFKGAKYTPEDLKITYDSKVKKLQESFTNTIYPDFPLEKIFKELYEDKAVVPSNELIENTAHVFRILSIKHLKLYDGAIELLRCLKESGKKIYLLSNAQRIFTSYEMRVLDIEKYFDDIFFSSDYNICKPEKTFFDALLTKHNINVNESIMIGNDPICDIDGAKNVGLSSLYIHSNLSPEITGHVDSTYTLMDMNLRNVIKTIIKNV
ncbi:HAD family hydrolase [Clostridium sp. 3-3]|uniref:HAD family hydrolase n=1 Tax=Clostridium sp. 3-3 TaxID=2070757 RepID=UPI000CDAA927|nr:HAD family hydrolase [Clostridium sp. 3-3]POO86641.1 HAD family hydrolase [Clostridium sp. 3-3]